MNENYYLVTLDVPPAIESTLVDSLLLLEVAQGFCSYPVSAHHHQHQGLTLSEQVTGRQKDIRFQIQIAAAELEDFLSKLRQEFSGSGFHYWVVPVISEGVL